MGGRVPRNGFFEASQQAAWLGRGPDMPCGPRLAYGPGPGGTFEACCPANYYNPVPLHLTSGVRTPFFFLPPKKEPPKFKTIKYDKIPSWCERISKSKEQLALERSGYERPPSRGSPSRPGSASALLEKLEKQGGKTLAHSQSLTALLKNAPPGAKIGVGCCGVFFLPEPGSGPTKYGTPVKRKPKPNLLPNTK
jgi:hypothetical protein